MDEDLKKNIAKAKELWDTARHAAMATVNTDGSPHNTPFRFMHDAEAKCVYWTSYPDAIHSQNVIRTGAIFVVLYDAFDTQKGGLYISADDGHILEGEELIKALVIINELRMKENKSPVDASYYSGDGQKMWSARITNLWVNNAKRDANGQLNRDSRKEVSVADLLSK